jgi:hypothetical protein
MPVLDRRVVVLLALAGCGSSQTASHDASSPEDARTHADGSSHPRDAAPPRDAATSHDALRSHDAEGPQDTGGVSSDATAPNDGPSAASDAHDASVVTGCAVAPTLMGASGSSVSSWTRMTGMHQLDYFGDGYHDVDVTQFAEIFHYWSSNTNPVPWPGGYGILPSIGVPIAQYLSAEFTVPKPYFTASNVPAMLYGNYGIGESCASVAVSMTISTHCGDFGQLQPTTIVPGCMKNKIGPDDALVWHSSGTCVLEDGVTYYLNVINADISALGSGGGATSTASSKCNLNGCANPEQPNTCSVPIQDGPGTWSNYVPM